MVTESVVSSVESSALYTGTAISAALVSARSATAGEMSVVSTTCPFGLLAPAHGRLHGPDPAGGLARRAMQMLGAAVPTTSSESTATVKGSLPELLVVVMPAVGFTPFAVWYWAVSSAWVARSAASARRCREFEAFCVPTRWVTGR